MDVLSGAIEVPYTYLEDQMALLIDTSQRMCSLDAVAIEVAWN